MNEQRALVLRDTDDRLITVSARELLQQAPDYVDDDAGSGIDIRAIIATAYRNRYVIGTILAIALALAFATILSATKMYRAETTIQVEQQSTRILSSQPLQADPTPQEAERFLDTQLDIIKSRAVAASVVRELNLARDPNFFSAMGSRPPVGVTGDDATRAAVDVLQKQLTVSLPRNSRIVTIAVDSRNPRLAAKIANSFASNYITSNLQRRLDTSAYSRNFLQKQLILTKARLEGSERSLIAYARQAGLVDASAGVSNSTDQLGPKSLVTSNLVQVNQVYSQAQSARVQAQQRWDEARRTPVMSLPEVLGNPAIQQLTQKRAELNAIYEQQLQTRKEGHPAVQQAEAAVNELDRQISTLAHSIRNSIRDQYLVAAKQEQALARNVGQLKGQTLSEQGRSVEYNILKREVDTNRQLYDGLLQRYKEIGAEYGVTDNNISVIDAAEAPRIPFKPRPALIFGVALLAAFLVALAAVCMREALDVAVRSPEDVNHELLLPAVAVTPLVKDKQQSVGNALADPRSPLSEALQSLRSWFELASIPGPRTLLLTSSHHGEGKSTTAFAMARDLARSGQRVLLIDADLRKPSLHRMLRANNDRGLASLLAHSAPIDDVVQSTTCPGLMFMPSGPLPPNPAQALRADVLRDLFETLAEQYDAVIVDGPPVLGFADAPCIASTVARVLFIVEANAARPEYAKAALARLTSVGAHVTGAVLTKFDLKKTAEGYGYGYNTPQQPEDVFDREWPVEAAA